MAQILVIDDDSQLRRSFSRLLEAEGYTVLAAPSGEKGLELVADAAPDMAVVDIRLPGMDGLTVFTQLRSLYPDLPVLVMTAFGSTDTAIEAIKMGAFDYVMKPFNVPEMLKLVERGVRAKQPVTGEKKEISSVPALLGCSVAMQEVSKQIGRVAPTSATVLVRGESGTGKELVARAVYEHSDRSAEPFVTINCVAIPETLLESELFGYERGAFTGATHRKVGKIESANRGTVFLDEIGDMPSGIQAKLLRLLQERQIERLGGKGPVPVDVRIIAATNRDLEAAVKDGAFREDLYYRLNVVTLHLPPLRERKRDIPMLAEHFIARYASELNLVPLVLTDDAVELLQEASWAGNVRELGNVIHKALIFSRGNVLDVPDIRTVMPSENGQPKVVDTASAEQTFEAWIRQMLLQGGSKGTLDELLNHFESLIIKEALNLTGGNRSRAAKLLDMSRPTLISRIHKYDLKFNTNIT
ncbi:MAG: sigma-54 dependent transcriptional regulator [Desulfovibrionales bacterium]|nr:sigma-54 dependent transcriptional regulator [Desulfovibrionales bacterium]